MLSRVAQVLTAATGAPATIRGWLRSARKQKNLYFLDISDGSTPGAVQAVFARAPDAPEPLLPGTGAAVVVTGEVARTRKGRPAEIAGTDWQLVGGADASYPLQKKKHSRDFVRNKLHLRARTNTFGTMLRVRSDAASAIHASLRAQDCHWIHTPILSASDCEGGSSAFAVAGADEFFGRPMHLTVSGQLHAEAFALGLGRVYTFGPCFRAEPSHTSRHLAEFWMVEPELAFASNDDAIDLAIQVLADVAADANRDDLLALQQAGAIFGDHDGSVDLAKRADALASRDVARISYSDALVELERAAQRRGLSTTAPVWGDPLGSEHERYLTDVVFQKPCVVHDYPADAKPFYMKCSPDGRTAQCFDLLLPGIGEVVGGGAREDKAAVLEARMKAAGISGPEYDWYLDLRRYGSAPHAGFGLGFERLLMYLTATKNIRDVVPVPRSRSGGLPIASLM